MLELANKVKRLRTETGASIHHCEEALKLTGSEDKAKIYLRLRGCAISLKTGITNHEWALARAMGDNNDKGK